MIASYNPFLVALALMIAVLASHTILDVAARVHRVKGNSLTRRCWLLGGAAVIGNALWTTHFLGLLSLKIQVGASYDPWMAAFAMLVAVSLAYAALRVTTEGELSRGRIAQAGVLLGLAMVASQYLGLMSLRVRPSIGYRPAEVALSLVLALAVAGVALWITFLLPAQPIFEAKNARWAGAVVLGLGIAGVHALALQAAIFPPVAVASGVKGLGTPVLVGLIAVSCMVGVAVTLGMSVFDKRIDDLLLSAKGSLHTGTQRLNAMNGLDPVTGISSRATFLHSLEKKMTEARHDEKLLGLVFLDLDGFKTINDSLGYVGGDAVLRAFADDLQRRTRTNTILGRMGADEFAVVLDGFDDPDKLEPMAKSILERMKTEFEVEGATLRVTASAGVALYPRDGENVDTLLKNVCVAKQHAKQAGKNSFRVFDATMSDAESRTTQITRGFGEALTRHQFSLVFQPKFDGRGNRVTGAEALIRWTHPVLGNIPPMDFIPLAEETGQIVPISEWVIGEVCRQMNVWRKQGLPPVKVAINLSPEQLRLSGYAERVSAMVREAGIDTQWIMFEITETAAMREPKLAMAAIAEFQTAGFDFAIDDFGTGYSSMAYLQQFRVKELKIDRFFIGSLEDGPEGHTIVAAIIALAHALHMTVVAEGVETASQLKELNGMDCDEVQGYLLGRPLTPADFEKLLRGEAERDELAGVPRMRHEGQTATPRLMSAIA